MTFRVVSSSTAGTVVSILDDLKDDDEVVVTVTYVRRNR